MCVKVLRKVFFSLLSKTMSKEPHLTGYARVSTDDRDLSLQIAALEKYGVPPRQIVREYASGGTMNRPEWQKVMRNMREGDTIVVWRLDRLGRTLRGVIETVEEMATQGVNIVSLNESVDTSTAMGKAFFQIAMVFAELERNLISERTKAGMAQRRAEGVKFGPKHSIADNEKRLAKFRELVEGGAIDVMTDDEVRQQMNAADPKAPPIRSPNTLRNWRANGYPGLE